MHTKKWLQYRGQQTKTTEYITIANGNRIWIAQNQKQKIKNKQEQWKSKLTSLSGRERLGGKLRWLSRLSSGLNRSLGFLRRRQLLLVSGNELTRVFVVVVTQEIERVHGCHFFVLWIERTLALRTVHSNHETYCLFSSMKLISGTNDVFGTREKGSEMVGEKTGGSSGKP